MTTKRSKVISQSRMFHSIVLMGSGLSLGCGGVAKLEGGSPGAAGSSSMSVGGAGGFSPGAAGNSLIIVPSAGSPNHGGAAGVAGSLASAGALSCPPAQWTCIPQEVDCPGYGGLKLPTGADCKCDPTRPASAADCEPGWTFVCMAAERAADGTSFIEEVPYGCMCKPTPIQPGDCSQPCDQAYGIDRLKCHFPQPFASVDPSVMCECATIILK